VLFHHRFWRPQLHQKLEATFPFRSGFPQIVKPRLLDHSGLQFGPPSLSVPGCCWLDPHTRSAGERPLDAVLLINDLSINVHGRLQSQQCGPCRRISLHTAVNRSCKTALQSAIPREPRRKTLKTACGCGQRHGRGSSTITTRASVAKKEIEKWGCQQEACRMSTSRRHKNGKP
jgi:hypothetical protein